MSNASPLDRLPTIYILDGSVALTGGFVCARNIAQALNGRARVVLVMPETSSLGFADTKNFFNVIRLPIRPLRKKIMAVLSYLPALIWCGYCLRRKMVNDQSSVLLINDFTYMHGVICRLLGYRGRIVTWVRMDPAKYSRLISYVWLRLASICSNEIIAVSRFIQDSLPEKINSRLLYDGLELKPQQQQEKAEKPLKFIYIGNYIPGKGQDFAIEAFSRIAVEHSEASLKLFGGDMGLATNREYRDILQRRIDELNLESQIELHDFATDTGSVLCGARAALNFSDSESFSMTVLEASGLGLPVIATRSGGPEEIIVDSETGFLVPVGSVEAMANAMSFIAKNPDVAQMMGDAGINRVRKLFSFERFQAELLALLKLPEYKESAMKDQI